MKERPSATPPTVLLALLALLTGLAPALAAAAGGAPLEDAQRLLDELQPEAAIELLDPWIESHPEDAEALLLRSTARFVLADMDGGRNDLDRALQFDPGLRQGWLNRAALDVAEENLDAALAAFRRAEQLDPAAEDNSLNIGAVLLLTGDLDAASRRFATYLEARGGAAEARYLVATNYALAGYVGLSLEHLRRAVVLDERSRLRARNDPNFAALAGNRQFQQLLLTDGYTPPPGAHRSVRRFRAAYEGADGPLLRAVLDALQTSGLPYDPRIEVTPDWALVWSDLRIKVARAGGGGEVQLSAPAERFTPESWRRRSEQLFDQIAVQLYARRPGGAGTGAGRR